MGGFRFRNTWHSGIHGFPIQGSRLVYLRSNLSGVHKASSNAPYENEKSKLKLALGCSLRGEPSSVDEYNPPLQRQSTTLAVRQQY